MAFDKEKLDLDDLVNIYTLRDSPVKEESKSGNQIRVVETGEQTYFLKYRISDQKQYTKKDILEFNKNKKGCISHKYRLSQEKRDLPKLFEQEAKTLRLWEKEGVPTPRVKQTDYDSFILLDYLEESQTLTRLLHGSKRNANMQPFYDLLENYRNCVRENSGEFTVLHNDLHPGNILYEPRDEKFLFIDPGLAVDENIDTNELDAYFNLVFMYSMIGNYFIRDGENMDVRKDIVNTYSDILSSSERETMKRLNEAVDDDVLDRYKENNVASRIRWFSAYKTENFKYIDNLL